MRANRGVIRTGGGRLGSTRGGIREAIKRVGGKKGRKKKKKLSQAKAKTTKTNANKTKAKGKEQRASQRDIERFRAEQRRRQAKRK